MKEYPIRDEGINVIGKQGEHGVRTFLFPVTEWEQEFPEGTFSLLVTRPGEVEGIPVVTTVSDGYLRWVVGIVETELSGTGSCEFAVLENGDVAKSITYQTKVIESNSATKTPPEPYVPYVEQVATYAQSANESAERAEQAASTIDATVEKDGDTATIVVIDADGEIHSASVSDGESPSVGVDAIPGGHRITITDHAHPEGQTFDVMDASAYRSTEDDIDYILG